MVSEIGLALGLSALQLGQVFNPFLIAFGMVYRRSVLLAVGIVGQIVVFGLSGFKTQVFSIIFLPLLFFFMKRWRRNFSLALISGLIATVLLCAVFDRATNSVVLSSMITRRTLTGPGLLTGFYFEHFSQATPMGIGFRLSQERPIYGPPQEIGYTYFGDAGMDANANLWAEGFAEFGIPGIFGYTLLVAFLVWIYDSISETCNLELAALLAAMPAVALSNTAVTTALITHGGISVALLLYLSAGISRLAESTPGTDYDHPAMGVTPEHQLA